MASVQVSEKSAGPTQPYKHGEYPKHVHHKTKPYLSVGSREEEEAALKNGYALKPFPPPEPAPDGVSEADALKAKLAELEAENAKLKAKK